jgi:hypothetical protein
MILRGESHALRNNVELMKRLKSPLTIELLAQLQEFYEVRSRRILFEKDSSVSRKTVKATEQIEFEEFCHIIDLLDDWMKPPVMVNFNAKKSRV